MPRQQFSCQPSAIYREKTYKSRNNIANVDSTNDSQRKHRPLLLWDTALIKYEKFNWDIWTVYTNILQYVNTQHTFENPTHYMQRIKRIS